MNWLNNTKKRTIFFQLCALIAVIVLGYLLVQNAQYNLAKQNITTGFGFLDKQAGFSINQTLIDYEPTQNYARAILVGLGNTLLVAILGVVGCIVLGTLIGIGKLSSNWLLRQLSTIYIEVFRNIPVLLQLFFWYALMTELLPKVRDALNPLPNVYLSNKGLITPQPEFFVSNQHGWIIAGLFCFSVLFIKFWQKRMLLSTGKKINPWPWYGLSLLVVPTVIFLLSEASLSFALAEKTRFGYKGGLKLSSEFIAVLLGLTLYTAAFVAEIVRSGIQSVDKGQTEAAQSLGFKPNQILNLIILPQALRVIIPPLTSQMMNLTKNSSLAVAVGYPELVNVTQTTMNQTGQAIEAILILMSVYLSLSLITSLFMNWYNKKIRFIEK